MAFIVLVPVNVAPLNSDRKVLKPSVDCRKEIKLGEQITILAFSLDHMAGVIADGPYVKEFNVNVILSQFKKIIIVKLITDYT